ncbi:MAG: ThiF family adenylyltransferase [Methylococcaceae bacterium]
MLEFYDVCGESISQELEKLVLVKARAVFKALAFHDEFKLIEIKVENLPSFRIEHLIVDVTADIIQYPKNDINYTECLCLSFYESDNLQPSIKALRKSFPSVIHTNLTPLSSPKSLCIYNENWHTVQLTWTAMNFLNRISYWLAQTSRDTLHFEDQPLEPLLINPRYKVVISEHLFNKQDECLVVAENIYDNGKSGVLILNSIEIKNTQGLREHLIKKGFNLFYALPLKGQPQQHGIIHNSPNTLNELNDFLKKAQIDLLSELRKQIKKLYQDGNKNSFENDFIIVLLELPKLRNKNSNTAEVSDYKAFLIGKIKDVGLDIGVLIEQPSQGIVLNILLDCKKNGEQTAIELLEPILSITPSISADFNSIIASDLDHQFAMIGAGALGSQILQHFVRMGYGQWLIIDDDDFLPHNVARHILNKNAIGWNKAEALSHVLNNVFDSETVKSISDNFLTLNANQLEQINKVEAIIDVSTSLPVARKLALETKINARKLSVFVTPSGNDSVLLCEDSQEKITLDVLEAQYYRALINEPRLFNHLNGSQGTIRYGGGCREISSRIPQDSIALHASILSKQIRKSLAENKARISVWIANNDDGSVNSINIPIEQIIVKNKNGWIIIYDKGFVEKIKTLRESKLPNETGGVLIGFFDTQRKRAYIVDTLKSPKDSIETDSSYIRGKDGLADEVKKVQTLTANIVDFMGEWHSHPNSANISPSEDDKNLLEHHKALMRNDGLPAIILIVGKNTQLNWIIAE